MTIKESLEVFKRIVKEAHARQLKVRIYLSTAFGCPFEGKVSSKKSLKVLEQITKLNPDLIALGDTIGVAQKQSVDALVPGALKICGAKKLAVHFHDTRGTALLNAFQSFDHGVQTFDASAGGLGGCPFAPGATGNLATEDLVYAFERAGVKTGVNLMELCKGSVEFSRKIRRYPPSRVLQAYIANPALLAKV